MNIARFSSLFLSLAIASQLVSTSAAFEWKAVKSVPSAGRSIHNTYGAASGRNEGLPDQDTSAGSGGGHTRTQSDFDRDFRGLDRGTLTESSVADGFSGWIGKIGNITDAVDRIKQNDSNVPPNPSNGGGGNNQGFPPSDDSADDIPIGQDDFTVTDLDYQAVLGHEFLGSRQAKKPAAGNTRAGKPRIEFLNATVDGLRFFEQASPKLPSLKGRKHNRVFLKSDAQYIWWELKLAFPEARTQKTFTIDAVWHDPEGRSIRFQTPCQIGKGWKDGFYSVGYGWPEPGQWGPGKYRVDLFIQGRKVASEEFLVLKW